MAKIEVDCVKLFDYGQYLIDKAGEFNTLKTKMQETLTSISEWEGIDADAFKSNSSNFYQTLSAVENELINYGNEIQLVASKYAKHIQAFYDALV